MSNTSEVPQLTSRPTFVQRANRQVWANRRRIPDGLSQSLEASARAVRQAVSHQGKRWHQAFVAGLRPVAGFLSVADASR
jgi:hypothetical protein